MAAAKTTASTRKKKKTPALAAGNKVGRQTKKTAKKSAPQKSQKKPLPKKYVPDLTREDQYAIPADKFPIVSGNHLALVLGITSRTVQRLASEQGMPKLGRDRYDLRAVFAWHIRQSVGKVDSELNRRLKRAQADEREVKAGIAAVRLAVMKGEVIDAAAAEMDLIDRVLAVKRSLETLAEQLTIDLAGLVTKKGKDLVSPLVKSAVLSRLAAMAKEPGEFSEPERRLVTRFSLAVVTALAGLDDVAAQRAAVAELIDRHCPELVRFLKVKKGDFS